MINMETLNLILEKILKAKRQNLEPNVIYLGLEQFSIIFRLRCLIQPVVSIID